MVGGCRPLLATREGNDSIFPAARQPRRVPRCPLDRHRRSYGHPTAGRQSSRVTAPGGTGEAAAGAADQCEAVAQSRIEDRGVILRTERETDGIGRQAAVYGVFVLLVVMYTWPLVANPGAHLRQCFDVHYFVWEMGWVARRIFEAPRSLFEREHLLPVWPIAGVLGADARPGRHRVRPGLALSRKSDPRLQRDGRAVPGAGRLGRILRRAPADGERRRGMGGGDRLRSLAHSIGLLPLRAHAAVVRGAVGVSRCGLASSSGSRGRDLAWALFFVWCQMVTVMYFGIPLILMLGLSDGRGAAAPPEHDGTGARW